MKYTEDGFVPINSNDVPDEPSESTPSGPDGTWTCHVRGSLPDLQGPSGPV